MFAVVKISGQQFKVQEGANFNGSVKMTVAKESKESKDTGSSSALRTGTGA